MTLSLSSLPFFGGGATTEDVVGVDLGSGGAKTLHLQRLGDDPCDPASWRIRHFGFAKVSPAMIVDRRVQDSQQEPLAEAIAEALGSSRAKKVALALPTAQTASRIFFMPENMTLPEEEDYVHAEVERLFGEEAVDMQWDFERLGPAAREEGASSEEGGEGERCHVRAVVSKRDLFIERQQLITGTSALSDRKLEVAIMDTEELAVERVMRTLVTRWPHPQQEQMETPPTIEAPDEYGLIREWLEPSFMAALKDQTGGMRLTSEQGPIEVFVDLGHEMVTLYAFCAGRVIYSHEDDHGVGSLIEEAAHGWGVAPDDLRQWMLSGDFPEDQRESWKEEVAPQMAQSAAEQIQRLVQNLLAFLGLNHIHRLWLAGGGALIPGLCSYMEEATGVLTRQANPLAGLALGNGVDSDQVNHLGPLYALAFGLATHPLPSTSI